MYQNILLVTDLEDDTDIVAQKAKWILSHNAGAQLTVLHVVEETTIGFGYELIPAASLYDEINDERTKEARTRLAQVLARNELEVHDVNINTAISGRKGIVDFCKTHTVDLVVIGRHKRTGLSAWITGSTVDSILPDLNADLLVVQLTV
ncbi:MAG: universal stress protein [Moraxella sp.]|nr:universal stress protein [Moraxella sp.]